MAFLLVAVFASIVLTYAVVWYHRRPKSMEDSISEFSRGLQAIAPRASRPSNGEHGGEHVDERDPARRRDRHPHGR